MELDRAIHRAVDLEHARRDVAIEGDLRVRGVVGEEEVVRRCRTRPPRSKNATLAPSRRSGWTGS